MNSPLYLALGVEEVLQTALLDAGMGDTEAADGMGVLEAGQPGFHRDLLLSSLDK